MDIFLNVDNKQVLDRINKIERNLENIAEKIIKNTATEMVKRAQKKFNSAKYDGDSDVYVYAVRATSTKSNSIRYKVVAEGSAVLFIEFGAGITYQNDANQHPYRQLTTPPMSEIGWFTTKQSNIYSKNWFGSRGKDDYWVFKQKSPIQRPTPNLMVVGFNSGHTRTGYYWTAGNKPARAMYSAITYFTREIANNAIKEVSKI